MDIDSPISGTIEETNSEVENSPDLLNTNCYDAWICKIKAKDLKEKENLMNIDEYSKYVKEIIENQ